MECVLFYLISNISQNLKTWQTWTGQDFVYFLVSPTNDCTALGHSLLLEHKKYRMPYLPCIYFDSRSLKLLQMFLVFVAFNSAFRMFADGSCWWIIPKTGWPSLNIRSKYLEYYGMRRNLPSVAKLYSHLG